MDPDLDFDFDDIRPKEVFLSDDEIKKLREAIELLNLLNIRAMGKGLSDDMNAMTYGCMQERASAASRSVEGIISLAGIRLGCPNADRNIRS